MHLTDHERLGRGLVVLRDALRPYLDEHLLFTVNGEPHPWWRVLEQREKANGRSGRISTDDPRVLLRVVRDEWRSFSPKLSRTQTSYSQELVDATNRWAHSAESSFTETDRALDTMVLLLESLDVAEEHVAKLQEVLASAPPALRPTTGDVPELDDMSRPSESSGAPAQANALASEAEGARVHRKPAPRSLPRGVAEVSLAVDDVDVRVTYRESLNWALVHGDVPAVLAIEIQNHGGSRVDLGTLEISIQGWSSADEIRPLLVDTMPVGPGQQALVPSQQLKWRLSPSLFAHLDEAATALLTVTVPAHQRIESEPVRILAADEWDASAPPELLAPFVRPRDPEISRLLAEAGEHLRSSTGDPSIDGYQRGPERAQSIAQAIYEAMQRREIQYSEPPASFERTGQKIRTPSEVLTARQGTCLDLAVTYAAALTAAGLQAVLAIVKGHAFTGWLRREEVLLPATAISERSMVLTVADSADFDAVELTLLTARDVPVGFDTARGAVQKWWGSQVDDVQWLLDVQAAHRRVRPLPVVRDGGSGVVEVEVEAPVAASTYTPRDILELPQSEFPPRVAQWRRSLLDLTNRNPLLNLRKKSMQVHVPRGSLAEFEDQLASGQRFDLTAHDDVSDLHVLQGARTAQDVAATVTRRILLDEHTAFVALRTSEYTKKLVDLQRKARTEFEESGANTLFLALGTLVFEATSSPRSGSSTTSAPDEHAAPLFLLPVRLEGKKDTGFHIVADESGVPVPNECLLEKLQAEYGITVPELADPGVDESGIDIPGALQATKSALLAAKVSNARVEEDAYLGLFQFQTLEMWRDLTDNWRELAQRPVVRHLIEKPLEAFEDEVPDPTDEATAEATTYLPIAADGSQLEAVRWAEAGKSFVLEGPPGTGKSQTITNLIAHCLAQGKKVLFVAEKQAALDVVRRRLDAVGLGPFTLDLHGRKQTPSGVRQQLQEALEVSASSNASFATMRSTYESTVESLARYPELLDQAGPTGRSAYEVRQVILHLQNTGVPSQQPLPDLPPTPRTVVAQSSPAEVEAVARRLGDATTNLKPLPFGSPWRLAGPLPVEPDGHLDTGARARVAQSVGVLFAAADRVRDPAAVGVDVTQLIDLARTPDDLRRIASWLESLSGDGARTTSEVRGMVDGRWRARVLEAQRSLAQHQQDNSSRLGVFTPGALGQDLAGLLTRSIEADGKLFKKKRRRAIAAELAPATRQGTEVDLRTLTVQLRDVVIARDASISIDQQIGAVPGVALPHGWNPLDPTAPGRLDSQVKGIEAAAQLVASIESDRLDAATGAILRELIPTDPFDAGPVRLLADSWTQLARELAVEEPDLAAWQQDDVLTTALDRVRPRWEDDVTSGLVALDRWNAFSHAHQEARALGLSELADLAGRGGIPGEDVEYAATLSFAQAELDERLDATNLRYFDDAARARQVARFITTGVDVRERLRTEIPAKLVAARTFDVRRPQGRVGEFVRELKRKRGAMKTRGLLHNYGSVITQITPCVMMSPGSVARFLPPDAVDFDLVVFDEASQIRVPDAIGAMGRGAAVVVVGDSQQMPPTSVFQAGSAKDDDEDGSSAGTDSEALALRDETSILEQANQSHLFPQALVALPVPRREPHRVLERALLRPRAVELPHTARPGRRHRARAPPRRRPLGAGTGAGQPRGGRRGRRHRPTAHRTEPAPVGRGRHVQHPATQPHPRHARRPHGRTRAAGFPARGRAAVREEPGERPGRRTGRHPLHPGLRTRCDDREDVAQLGSRQPTRRGEAAQRRHHARQGAGRPVLVLRAGTARPVRFHVARAPKPEGLPDPGS
jgi:hypothetical protein